MGTAMERFRFTSQYRLPLCCGLALAGWLLAGEVAVDSAEIPDLHAELAYCPVLPLRAMPYANCCGVFASSSLSTSELLAAFPATWEERPLSGVGLAVRPPGLAFRFERPMRLHLVLAQPEGAFSFNPPDLAGHAPVTADSVFVSWPPFPPRESAAGATYFGDWQIFWLEPLDTALVVITATVNLAATYAGPDDTLLVWGTEIGMPDIELRRSGLATPTSVSPTTWGRIKRDALQDLGR